MTAATLASELASKSPRARRSGPWHRRVAGLHVLKVTGSCYDMGRQHGALLSEAVARGPIPYYRTYVEKFAGPSALGPLSPLLWPALKQLVGRQVERQLPDFARDAIRGLADGAELPLDTVMEGATMPDSMVWLASKLIALKRVGPAAHHRLALGLGCTSALAWGDATRDGMLLHARNTDYHGVASWPRTAAVVFHEPDAGLRYVSVVAAGIVMGGVTAMNEAGLTLTVHQHMFTDKARLGGTPIGVIGDIIMREARSLDDAERILGRQRPVGCWTYLVADGPRKQVLCWEESPQRHVAHRYEADDARLGYANIYLDSELGATERNLYGPYWRANLGRHQRANQMLDEGFGRIDPDAMAALLGSRGTTSCRLRDAIAMVMTVGSVVFRPEDGVLWVATGEAPVSQNAFEPFDLTREDHAPQHGVLTGGRAADPADAEAFAAYRRAYVAYVDEDDLGRGRALIDEARELQPAEPLYHLLAGLLAVAAGDAKSALADLGRALSLGHPDPERRASFRLWHGRAADLLGRREQAREAYRAAIELPADDPVHKAARRGLRRPYSRRRARKLHVDFAYADVVAP